MSGNDRMAEQHRVWETWARTDPLWAILSDPSRRGGKWDRTEFFASGVRDVDDVLRQLAARSIRLRRGRALDFGCGVGRLSQALAQRFDRCDGVDISETMIALAQDFNRYEDRCRYQVNKASDLGSFDDASFDFIFSMIVLQHNPPELAELYIGEFLRILSPHGVAVFDMTVNLAGSTLPHGSHRGGLRITRIPRQLPPAGRGTVVIDVSNTSGVDWPARSRLAVGNHWRAADDSRIVIHDDGRAPLRQGLANGSTQRVRLPITAPPLPNQYQLEIDLVEEGTCWFRDRGSPPVIVPVAVRPSTTARLREQVRSLVRRTQAREESASLEQPTPFAMHGLARDRVEQVVKASGGTVVDVLPNQTAGENWDAFRYFVVKS